MYGAVFASRLPPSPPPARGQHTYASAAAPTMSPGMAPVTERGGRDPRCTLGASRVQVPPTNVRGVGRCIDPASLGWLITGSNAVGQSPSGCRAGPGIHTDPSSLGVGRTAPRMTHASAYLRRSATRLVTHANLQRHADNRKKTLTAPLGACVRQGYTQRLPTWRNAS